MVAPRSSARGSAGVDGGRLRRRPSDFQLSPERLDAALSTLQASTGTARSAVTVLARVRGLAIASPELSLADGLEIVREEALPGPLPDMGASFACEEGEPVFIVARLRGRGSPPRGPGRRAGC